MIPEIASNLLSVGQLTDVGYEVIFSRDAVRLLDKSSGEIIFEGRRTENGLYELNPHDIASLALEGNEGAGLLHHRCGHIACSTLRSAIENGLVKGVKLTAKELERATKYVCKACALNKLTRSPHPRSVSKITKKLDLMLSDILGPFLVHSINAIRLFLKVKTLLKK